MNIKALLLTGLLTVGSASPALALAYPGANGGGNTPAPRTGNTPARVCNFSNTQSDTWLRKDDRDCTVTKRINSNGHTVYDVQTWDLKTTVVLWNNGTCEYWQNGNRYTGEWSNHNGYTEVYNGGYSFRF